MSRTAEEWGRVAVSLPGMLDTEGDRWGGVTLYDGAREVLLQNAHDKATACESPANSDAFKTRFRQEILNEFNYLVAIPKE